MPENKDSIGKLYNRQLGPSLPVGQIQAGEVVSPHMQSGIITGVTRDQLPISSGISYVNARIRDEWMGRRPGTGEFGGTKPDSNPILALITFISESEDTYLCRVTTAGFHVANAAVSGWTSYTVTDVDGNPATFPAGARFTVAQLFDKLYLADGINPLWEVDFNFQTVKQIPGSPKAKFVTTFAERPIVGNVGVAVGGLRPASVYWPVNSDPYDWEGFTSGNEDLAYQRVGDPIAGMAGIGDMLLIVRRSSLWAATRQPFQQPVFRFKEIVNGFGSDLPYTLVQVPGGVIYANQRELEVYFFSPGGGPTSLVRDGVGRTLFQDLRKLTFAEAAYDPYEREYHLGLVIGEGEEYITRTWVYSLRKQAWIYDDSPEISTLGVVLKPSSGTAIDDLVGTIDGLSGSIDELGAGASGITPTLFKGTATGEVIEQSYDHDHDWDGTEFEMEYVSQDLGSVSKKRTIQELGVEVIAPNDGEVILDQRNEREIWRNTKIEAFISSDEVSNARITHNRITGNKLFFRLRSTLPGVKFYSWWMQLMERSSRR